MSTGSILIDIVIANVKWFSDKNLNSKTKETSPDYTQKKEIYRQIKFALERQGDRISSLKFKALEMNAYKKELFATVENRYKRIFNKSSKNFKQSLIIFLKELTYFFLDLSFLDFSNSFFLNLNNKYDISSMINTIIM